MKVVSYERTPNPDALKCIVDGVLSDRPRSFLTPGDAEGDALAGPLFATGWVRAVLINNDWVSVNKKPGADWRSVKPVIERTLASLA